MTTLINSTAAEGGSGSDVRQRLKEEIKKIGYDYCYIRVAPSNGTWAEEVFIYSSCSVLYKGEEHDIRVFMK